MVAPISERAIDEGRTLITNGVQYISQNLVGLIGYLIPSQTIARGQGKVVTQKGPSG